MPKLLDNRLISYDLADVTTRSYADALAGNVLRVGADGKSMELGTPPPSLDALLARESELQRTGLSLQQYMCNSWVDCTPGGFFTSVFGLAYGMGKFIAVGQNGSSAVIAASNVSTAISGNGPNFTNLGISWSNINLTGLNLGSALYHVIYAQGKFVACGENGSVLTSVNGISWNQVRQGTSERLYRVSYGPGIGYVFVGSISPGTTDQPGVTIFSKDLVTFTTLANPALGKLSNKGVPIYGVGYGNGTFVAVGGLASNWGSNLIWSAQDILDMSNHHIATSTNGTTWTLRSTAPEKTDCAHYCVEWGNGRFMVGTNQPGTANVNEPNIIVTDNMGTSWFLSGASSLPIYNGNVQTISYGNGIVVAGDLGVQLSNDCLTFQKLTGTDVIPTNYTTGTNPTGSASAYGNGLFLVGNREGKIMRSRTALETWTTFGYVNSLPGGGGGGGSGITSGNYVNATTPFVPNTGDIGSYTLAVAYNPQVSNFTAAPGVILAGNYLYWQDVSGNIIATGFASTTQWKNMGGGSSYSPPTISGSDQSPTFTPEIIRLSLWMRIS